MRLHALVDNPETARIAVEGGATMIQLRLKGVPTEQCVAVAVELRPVSPLLIINDDVHAAIAAKADGVHLGQDDLGVEIAQANGMRFGISVDNPQQAIQAQKAGAWYLGAGPIWSTPTKLDAVEPIGLEGLRAICGVASVPVIAIGSVDAENASSCITAGASGVAVIRATTDCAVIRRVIDPLLDAALSGDF